MEEKRGRQADRQTDGQIFRDHSSHVNFREGVVRNEWRGSKLGRAGSASSRKDEERQEVECGFARPISSYYFFPFATTIFHLGNSCSKGSRGIISA